MFKFTTSTSGSPTKYFCKGKDNDKGEELCICVGFGFFSGTHRTGLSDISY